MSHDSPAKDRPLAIEDRTLHPGWELIEFLASIGADEFTMDFLYVGDDGKAACDRLVQKLAFASLGQLTRECTVTYANESNPRPIEVYRLNAQAREVLRAIMPEGIFDSGTSSNAWVEDVCVYRRGELLFGTVLHEKYAFVRLTEFEWQQWEARSTLARTKPKFPSL